MVANIAMKLGIENLLKNHRDLISGRRVGVLAHRASVNANGEHSVDVLSRDKNFKVTALFGPEHGIATQAEDMEAVEHVNAAASGIPIYSLYGSTLDSLKPTKDMLADIDVLVIDLQDIGSRYYTYVWTACLSVEACAENRKKVIVCDRPNPIGGVLVEGPEIEEGYESFVGLHSILVRHGMTIGEIVKMVCNDKDVEVVEMEGWTREMEWSDTKLNWVNPSPNMRSYTAALLYPGMCLIEGTNISEGRGTDAPFEIVGAPYIDSGELISEFEKLKLPGVKAAPTSFIPMRQKWMGKICNGVRWIVTDTKIFRPYLTGLAFIWLINRMYGKKRFEWRRAPYEFVTNRPAIDLLTGSSRFHEGIDKISLDDIKKMSSAGKKQLAARAAHLLY